MTKAARLHFPESTLARLLGRDHGRPRAQAVAAMTVHIRALRLFAPGSPAIGDAQAAMVRGRIAALAAHLSMR